ncbi:MAG: SdrD B-like domain-containing protein [Gallionella sp.]
MMVSWVSVQAAPLMGTLITNQAQISYRDSVSGRSALLLSNIVELNVQQLSAFNLTSPQSRVVIPGETSNLPHQIRNTGNGVDTYTLSAVLLPGTGNVLNISKLSLYADANGDAIPDNFTPITRTPALPAGGVFNFVVAATAPVTALTGQTRDIDVSAIASATATPAPMQHNVDTLSISYNTTLAITKVFDVISGPSPHSNLTATLSIRNTGASTASNVTISDVIGAVNAAPAYDATGMAYIAGSAMWNGIPLSDSGIGNPAGMTYTATTVGAVTTINALVASLAPGVPAQITFKFSILPNLAAGSLHTNNIASVSAGVGANLQTLNSNTASYTVIPSALGPDLTLTKTHVGTFNTNLLGTFNLGVSNVGRVATTGLITVKDTLPAELTFVPANSGGNGWTCGTVLQVITCTHSTVIAAGGVAPNLPIVVLPTAAAVAASPLLNKAVVSGGGETNLNTINNTASDTVVVIAGTPAPDLILSKTHVGNFTQGFSGIFNFVVSNIGLTSTVGLVTVSDTLPTGLIFDPATSGGNGWTCSAILQVVTCSNPVVIASGASLSFPVGIIPNAAAVAASPLSNTARVSGGGEPAAYTTNNSATDPLIIVGLAASVSGYVWLDNNHDKIFNAGEIGAAGWQAELMDAAGKVIATALSNAAGLYIIGSIMPGTGYQLRFRDPSTSIVYASPILGDGTVIPLGSIPPPAGTVVLNGVITGLSLNPGDNVVELDMPLDPSGVVYDSVTRLPIPGAIVTLTCPTCTTPFDPALHLFGGAINQVQTVGTTGFYQFLLFSTAPAGLYQIQVTPPAGYIAPSALIPAQTVPLTPPTGVGKFMVQAQMTPPPVGSPTLYYFAINVFPGMQDVINNHIPLDPVVIAGSGLLVSKVAGRTTAEPGDFIDYTVVVKNVTTVSLPSITLMDSLPRGFTYQLGTARLNGVAVANPVGGMGPQLTFTIGTLATNTTATLTYRLAVGITAPLGTGTNSAQAISGIALSNIAKAKVQIVPGVFSDKAYILGTVYMDCNKNHVQEPDEPGIPGIRLYLENGTYGVTDTDGKYSFYGVDPRTHHLKLDKTTLPVGAQLEVLANRHAGVAGGRFVDLKNSELHRADFASDTCSDAVMQEVKVRHSKDTVSETERVLNYRLNPNAAVITPADTRVLPASGELIKTAPATAAENYQPLAANSGLNSGNSNLPSAPIRPVVSVDMDTLLLDLDNTLGFMDLKDHDVLPMAQTAVRIKGVMGSVFRLTVNGVEVSDTRVGKKSSVADKALEAWEYLGVALKPGENVLTIKQFDSFGNERAQQSITVIAPDQLAKIKIEAAGSIEANGRTPLHVKIQLVDDKGVAVNSRTYLTLESVQGRWQVQDFDLKEPGIQVAIEGGRAEFDLLPPTQPGQETLRIMSGVLKGEHLVAYIPELRPLLVSGIIEGALNMHSLKASNLTPVTAQDSFDQEIKHLSRGNAAGNAGVRAAMFLKGKVKGEYLLTLAYDSDKNVKDRLFRDIQPDEFYPVYGDSANKGFDAQSTSRLYVRVDQGKSYLMYGDFGTRSEVTARSLSQYSRSLTGVREHYENGKVMVNAFASRDTLRQVIQDIPANGTSGPYQLSNNGALINSEKVEILTWDRNHYPNVILKVEPQTRFADYEIEQFTGRLLFKGPVASLDSNLNPRSIRVTYELDQGGTGFWVTGVDGQVKLTDRLEIGGVVVRDSNPMAPVSVIGTNATLKLTEKTLLVGEVAHTNTLLLGGGNAQRVELRQDAGDFQGRIYSGRTDTTFDNTASMLNKGRVESGGKGTFRINGSTLLTGEMINSTDQLTKAKRDGVLVKVEKTLNDIFRVEVGMRDTRENTGVPTVAPIQVTSARVKTIAQVPSITGLSVNAEYEQDVKDSGKKMAALGAEYQMMNRGRLYARHEFITSLSSAFTLNPTQRTNNTVLGINTDYTPNTHVFSEYRARGVMDGREAEAAVGLRNKWQVAEGLRFNTGVERVTNLAGGAGRSSQAYTGAVEYTRDPFWKGSARLEYRTNDTSDGWLNSVDIARRLTDSWTVIGKQVFSENATKGATGGARILHRMQAGLAWRDMVDHDWNALSKFEHRRESDTTSAATVKRVMDIFSVHVNYQADSDWQASGHYAAKWLTDESMGLSSRSNTHLASGRIMWDLTERWDAGILGSVMGDRGFRSLRYGMGAETGYLLQENLWLSVGYNFFGFKDTDLIGQNATDRGFFIRLRFKFDEDLFTGVPNRVESAARNCKP